MRTYGMNEMLDVTKFGEEKTVHFLKKMKFTDRVLDVRHNKNYQKQDVDFLWYRKKQEVKIEVKTDQQYKTGNYFFETISNDQKNTPGCFLLSTADLFFYFYVFEDNKKGEIHIMKLKKVREWFQKEKHRFREVKTSTKLNGKILYHTIGKLVPRQDLIRALKEDVKIISFSNDSFTEKKRP
jgi:hypothetical protein